jgi:hypothetical protein
MSGAFKEWIPRALARSKMWWGENGFDLAANVQQYGADQALVMKAEYEAEQQELERIVQVQKLAESEERLNYQRAEYGKLAKVRPEFTSPTARAEREAFAKAMLDIGFTADQLEMIPAAGVDLALDGIAYRKAQADAKAKAKAPPKPAAPALKPSAAIPASSANSNLQKLRAKAYKSGDADDMVKLMVAEEEAQRRA